MSTTDILTSINQEDHKIAAAVEAVIPQMQVFIDQLLERFNLGGRLIYIGAGTSGRLGVVDASEIPPTFGMDHSRVIGMIAGGDGAIRKAVEFAEDSPQLAIDNLKNIQLSKLDTVIGIAASGTTPYVIGGVKYARSIGSLTACITNNRHAPLSQEVDHPIAIIVGPEFVTGSTRMKSGTSQKLVLNMISTALMIRIGRVQGNKMVHMQLNNDKLVRRGVRFIMEELGVSHEEAVTLLDKHGSVQAAIQAG
ncbi:UNVERIFIED_CONTAM: hypothetical protein GTU68_002087 [Idotea baltica]|nr:hypothetical protein [Idotea baltica]